MKESDGNHAVVSGGQGDVGGELQEALRANEVGLEMGAERIAAPGDARDANAALAQERVVDGHAERSLRGQMRENRTPNYGEEGCDGEPLLGEETIGGGPIEELLTAGGEQASHGMTTEAKQAAQRERLGAFGDAMLGEGRGGLSPELVEGGEDAGGVFFRREGGGCKRRRARRLLSSMDHSTDSPREKSMACATAEGKLMYHCWLDLRLMSWTLVGKAIAPHI
jgi:hypothetical protein